MGDNDHAKRVGARIRRVRLERGLSQAALADRIGGSATAAYVSHWERGSHFPSRRYLELLGRALDVPAETFLVGD